jgi:HK97 family phage major capsid protein
MSIQELQDGIKSLQDNVIGRMKRLEDEVADLAQNNTILRPGGETKSVGSQVLQAAEAKAFLEGRTKHAVIPLALNFKALVGTNGDSNDNPVDVQAQRGTGIGGDARRSLQLLNDLPRVVVNSGSFEFHRIDGFTNAADVQENEGDLKAEQDMSLPIVTSSISTIAVTLAASQQLLADSPNLTTFLNDKLRFGVLEKLEREIIGGLGGVGTIAGLATQATVFTPNGNLQSADQIAEGMTELEVNGWMASHILLHPRDWNEIRTQRAAVSNGEYVGPGWVTNVSKNLWGTPVVTSTSVNEGEAIVLDARQVALLDRQSVTVEMGYTGNQFAQNLVTLRAEGRWGLAVYSPTAVLRLDLGVSSGG